MNQHLMQSLAALGLPAVAPEPEVLNASLARVRTRSLARIIADLINENEPMLRAEQCGSSVTVREIGGDGTMTFTIADGAAA